MIGHIVLCTIEENSDGVRETTSTVRIPAIDDDHEWSTWKEICAGYDNSPDWDCEQARGGYRLYRNRDVRSFYIYVETEEREQV